jgi:hypothetical protein
MEKKRKEQKYEATAIESKKKKQSKKPFLILYYTRKGQKIKKQKRIKRK